VTLSAGRSAIGTDKVVRAVLFDLDDTLFDHRLCAHTALSELHAAHPEFQACPLDDFEELHATQLEELHPLVTRGEMPLDEARRERLRRLFRAVGATPPKIGSPRPPRRIAPAMCGFDGRSPVRQRCWPA
jgi:hypothetical protein